jgi:MFS family permease
VAPTDRWRLLAILTASYGAGAFGMLGVSPLSPSLVHGFALSRLEVAFIVPSIYVGGLLFSVPAGRLADRIGVRPTLLGGLAVGGLALVAAAASPVFPAFLFCIFVAGLGWSVVNPALGRAIIDLFGLRERGIAMGLKQMGLTVGGVAAALLLPTVAAMLGWRVAIVMCGAVVALPVALAWRALRGLGGAAVTPEPGAASPVVETRGWSTWRRPTLVVFFASGLVLGMVQAAVLSYFPLYTVEVLGFDTIGAGFLVAASQAGGAVSRLALGAASDRWMAGRRSAWLAGTAVVAACVFALHAFGVFRTPITAGLLAFATGIGAYGWVGIFFVMSAEIGGPKDAGLLSGMAFSSIVVGLLSGPALFGLLLVSRDSYVAPWSAFAVLAAAVAAATLLAGPAMDRAARYASTSSR